MATATFDRELDYTLEENAEAVLQAINSALTRMEAGTYGRCQNCGQPISPERLEAIPWATRCIDCKRREERG
jgi:DnaK suppressor protein